MSAKPVQMKYILGAVAFLIPLYFVLVITAQYLTPIIGSLLAPLFGGSLLAIFVYMLSMFERKNYMSAINSEQK